MEYRRFRPDTEQPSPGEPARRFNHEDAAPVDHAEAKHHRARACPHSTLEEQALTIQTRPSMHRDGLPIEPARRRLRHGCRTLDMWEGNQDDSTDRRLESG